jgi:hypothetical protein
MRVHIAAFATLLPLALTGAGGALAADAGTAPEAAAVRCSEATLHGTYLFASEGTTVSGKGRGPFAIAGYDVYDGRGHQRGVLTVSANGKITSFIRDSGKYTVKPDCTGSVSFASGTVDDLFIAPDGSQFTFIQTDPGTVSAEFEQRVTARRVGD